MNIRLISNSPARVSSQEYSNLALNQQAEQQDDYHDGNGPASKAVDGNRDGMWRYVDNIYLVDNIYIY
jgi:hypothetical protein